jgi:undecaprenyl-diphosphatase
VHLITAALLGAVQGLTEFLPISSTAHLLLAERAIDFDDPGSAFTIIIQFGSILAVMWLYRAKIWSVVSGLLRDRDAQRFALMILVAFVPAALAAMAFKDFVRSVLHESPAVIAWAFILGGVVMLLVERFRPVPDVTSVDQVPMGRALVIGVGQALALIPGVSRSGATMVGGLLMRLDRKTAAEFSFFLAMPTIAAAFAKDLWEVRDQISPDQGAEIAVGFVMAFLAALVVVKPFLRFVSRSGFAPFAWYRIVAGVVILAALAMGKL